MEKYMNLKCIHKNSNQGSALPQLPNNLQIWPNMLHHYFRRLFPLPVIHIVLMLLHSPKPNLT